MIKEKTVKKYLCIFLGSMILLTACASTHNLYYYHGIVDEVKGRNVTIVKKNGDIFNTKIIGITEDTTLQQDHDSFNVAHIPTSQISEIHRRDHWKGAFEGAFFGAIGGGITTAILASKQKTGSLSQRHVIAAGILLITPAEAVVGGIIGGIIGHRDKYVIDTPIPGEYLILEIPPMEMIPSSYTKSVVSQLMESAADVITLNWQGRQVKIPLNPLKKDDKRKYYIKGVEYGAMGKFEEARAEL
jgi:hypothetical protein